MQINSASRRKAISPVLATVILIAITLIAAIAIAGFVFGLFGSFTSSARVSVTAPNVSHTLSGTALALGACVAATPAGNYIAAQNTGTATTSSTNVQFTYGGVTSSIAYTCTLTAGSTMYIPVTNTGVTAAVAGQSFTGAISLANGASAPFFGAFS